jgi:hypothetical protein
MKEGRTAETSIGTKELRTNLEKETTNAIGTIARETIKPTTTTEDPSTDKETTEGETTPSETTGIQVTKMTGDKTNATSGGMTTGEILKGTTEIQTVIPRDLVQEITTTTEITGTIEIQEIIEVTEIIETTGITGITGIIGTIETTIEITEDLVQETPSMSTIETRDRTQEKKENPTAEMLEEVALEISKIKGLSKRSPTLQLETATIEVRTGEIVQ